MENKKSAFDVAKKILTIFFVIIAVAVMLFTVFSVAFVNKNDRSVFGIKTFSVLTDSMNATDFDAGDVIVNKTVDAGTLKEGDIITFENGDMNDEDRFGEVITHKIGEVVKTEDGELVGFRTYGTTTGEEDKWLVGPSYVLGKYMFKIPKLGLVFQYIKTTPGYIVCILIPFLILIGLEGINCVKIFKQYKREQTESIESEREQLARERAESERMLKELEELRAKLEQKGINMEKPQEKGDGNDGEND